MKNINKNIESVPPEWSSAGVTKRRRALNMPSGQATDRLADRGSNRTPKGQDERVLERRCLTGQAPQQLSAGEAGQPEWPSPQRESILAKARSRALERRIVLGQLECRSTRAAERRVPGMTERRVPDIWVPERRSGRGPKRPRTGAVEIRSPRSGRAFDKPCVRFGRAAPGVVEPSGPSRGTEPMGAEGRGPTPRGSDPGKPIKGGSSRGGPSRNG